ncbi:MAG: hypothetical protein ABIA59_01815, partial [Candidatus Latescibacterota bacterium]
LLASVCGKSARQVDAIIARFRPMSVIHDRVRTVYIKTLPHAPACNAQSEADGGKERTAKKNITSNTESISESRATCVGNSGQKFTADVGGQKLTTFTGSAPQREVLEQKFKLEFAVNPDCMRKLEEARALLSKKHPRGVSFGQLLEALLDEYLAKHSPKRKILRRKKREANKLVRQKHSLASRATVARTPLMKLSAGKKAMTTQTMVTSTKKDAKSARTISTKIKKEASRGKQRSRHIPAVVKDKVFARDKGRCSFTSETRCLEYW